MHLPPDSERSLPPFPALSFEADLARYLELSDREDVATMVSFVAALWKYLPRSMEGEDHFVQGFRQAYSIAMRHYAHATYTVSLAESYQEELCTFLQRYVAASPQGVAHHFKQRMQGV